MKRRQENCSLQVTTPCVSENSCSWKHARNACGGCKNTLSWSHSSVRQKSQTGHKPHEWSFLEQGRCHLTSRNSCIRGALWLWRMWRPCIYIVNATQVRSPMHVKTVGQLSSTVSQNSEVIHKAGTLLDVKDAGNISLSGQHPMDTKNMGKYSARKQASPYIRE